MRILFTGGGTAGSVTPLYGVAEELLKLDSTYELHFVGRSTGVEREIISNPANVVHFSYHGIVAGKLRRYWDWRNVTDVFKIIVAVFQSMYLMLRYRPAVVISAGSFISVPVVWAAWITGRAVIVHQQDLQVGLATKLTAPLADVLTKAFAETSLRGATQIGNPVRNLQPTTDTLKLDASVPTVLFFGGGTGAEALATYITPQLCEAANIIHITGEGKPTANSTHPHYQAYSFLGEPMKEALAKADVVVARAGLGTISELAALGKPAYLVPMPNSHQLVNADQVNLYNAAVIIDQLSITPEVFTEMLLATLRNPKQQHTLSKNIQLLLPGNAARTMAESIDQLCHQKQDQA